MTEKVSPYTTIAIRAFTTTAQKEWQLAKAEHDLHHAVVKVPKEELSFYVSETEKIAAEYERKAEAYENRRHR